MRSSEPQVSARKYTSPPREHIPPNAPTGPHVVLPPKSFRQIEPSHERAIVYPWLSTAAKWEELRFSLRSIHRNFTDRTCPIYVIGDRAPSWLIPGGRVSFIRVPAYDVSREAGLWEAWQIGMQVARQVLWMNDDIYLLRSTGWCDFGTALHEGEITGIGNTYRAARSPWKQALGQAVEDLRLRGHETVMRFATHTPYLFEIEKSREIFREYHLHHKGSWVTLYHNHHRTPHEPCEPHKVTAFPFTGSPRFLNHKHRGPTEATAEFLQSEFAAVPPWEQASAKVRFRLKDSTAEGTLYQGQRVITPCRNCPGSRLPESQQPSIT